MGKKKYHGIRIWTFVLASVLFFCLFGNFKLFSQKAEADCPFPFEKIASYTTYFSSDDGGRYENIRLASKRIHGIIIQAYGEFSFNQWVGKRTKDKGYKPAKIISQGEFVEGVGGGVCQVSTTLYNAALKSGLKIVEYHPHSLQVGYVAPSRDAMVSSSSDLKIFNPRPFPVYLSAKGTNGAVCVTFFGKNEGYRYEITTKIIEEIPPPLPIVKEGEKEEIIRVEKAGVKSEAYLEGYKGGQLLFRRRLRTDEYRPIQGIIGKKIVKETKKIPSNACLF